MKRAFRDLLTLFALECLEISHQHGVRVNAEAACHLLKFSALIQTLLISSDQSSMQKVRSRLKHPKRKVRQ